MKRTLELFKAAAIEAFTRRPSTLAIRSLIMSATMGLLCVSDGAIAAVSSAAVAGVLGVLWEISVDYRRLKKQAAFNLG